MAESVTIRFNACKQVLDGTALRPRIAPAAAATAAHCYSILPLQLHRTPRGRMYRLAYSRKVGQLGPVVCSPAGVARWHLWDLQLVWDVAQEKVPELQRHI